MTLQASGAIDLNQVHVELGTASGTTISMDDPDVRTLLGVPSGQISMSNAYGKTGIITSGLILSVDANNTSSYPGSGTTWTDLSGINNTLSLANTTFSTGNMVFNGANSYAYKSGIISAPTTKLSLDIWVKLIDYTVPRYVCALGKDIGGATGGMALIAYGFSSLGYNIFFEFGSGSGRVSSGIVPPINTWMNWVVTADGTNTRIYRNGTLLASALQGAGSVVSGACCSIGSYLNASGSPTAYFHNGSIGSVRFYNRAISQVEISQNFSVTRNRFGI
jgi:hypothetical protein